MTRQGNDYYGLMLLESSGFGVQVAGTWAAATAFNCNVDIKKNVVMVDTTIKTSTNEPQIAEKIITGSSGMVTLSGDLCKEYDILLGAYFRDAAAGGYVIQAGQPAGFTYNIAKRYTDTTAKIDIALGCECVSFKITGAANGIIQFEAIFRAASVLLEQADLTTPTANAIGHPFLFAYVTNTLFNSATRMNSFELNLNTIFIDDAMKYQNSPTPLEGGIIRQEGTLNMVTKWDSTYDPTQCALIGSQTPVTNTISLVESTTTAKTWAIVTNCRIADYTVADPGKSIFTASYALELAGATAAVAITVTVT
jgi:hypothetical protein